MSAGGGGGGGGGGLIVCECSIYASPAIIYSYSVHILLTE